MEGEREDRERSKVITLPETIEFAGGKYSALTLHVPTLDELDAATGRGPKELRVAKALIASGAGIPEQVAGKLPADVVKEAMTWLMSFTDDAPATGES